MAKRIYRFHVLLDFYDRHLKHILRIPGNYTVESVIMREVMMSIGGQYNPNVVNLTNLLNDQIGYTDERLRLMELFRTYVYTIFDEMGVNQDKLMTIELKPNFTVLVY